MAFAIDQITRSSLSVASNIAEGMERDTVPDQVRFMVIARGSIGELRTQIYIGIEIGYIDKTMGEAWVDESKELSAMLTGLIRSLRS